MELYFKDNVSDITYKSELILDTKATITTIEPYVSRINSPKQLTLLLKSFRKLWAH